MSYDGGKGGAGVYQWIINQLPPHHTYIDCFLGHSAVMRYKRPAERSIGVEVNARVLAEFWRDSAIPDLTLVCGDALGFLRQHRFSKDTLLYLDPPYLRATRSTQDRLYTHEFFEIDEHRALLKLIRRLPCMVAISGYWSDLYELELAGWCSSRFWTVDRAGNRKEEWLWMNYAEPLELHDYRYLGRDYRERERIKRKTQRWVAKLETMERLERLALMEAIGSLRSAIAVSGDGSGAIASDDGIDEAPHQVLPPQMAVAAPTTDDDDTRWPAPKQLAMLDREELHNV
jgi:DNA adenine methylase